MFKKHKQLIIGFVLGALLFSGVSVAASNGLKSISVLYNNIKIAVNGKELKTDSEPFIYEGRTYVPIRVVSEALGAEVDWNNKTKTVEIKKPRIIAITPTISLIKYSNGDIYLGETKDGKSNGHGYKIYSYGSEVISNWIDDSSTGYGIVSWPKYYDGSNIIMVKYFGDDKPANADYIQIEPKGDILKVIKMKEDLNSNLEPESVKFNENLNLTQQKA